MKTKNNRSKNSRNKQIGSQERLLNPFKQWEHNSTRFIQKNYYIQQEIRQNQFDHFLEQSLPIPAQQNYTQLYQQSFNSFFEQQLKIQQQSYQQKNRQQSLEKQSMNYQENQQDNQDYKQVNFNCFENEHISFENIGGELLKLFKEKNRNIGTMKKLAKFLSLIIVKYFQKQFHHKQVLSVMFELMGFKLSNESMKKKFKEFFGRRVVDILNVLEGTDFLKKKGKYYQLNLNSKVARQMSQDILDHNQKATHITQKRQQNQIKKQMVKRMKFYCSSIKSKKYLVQYIKNIKEINEQSNFNQQSNQYLFLTANFQAGYHLYQNIVNSQIGNTFNIISDFQETQKLKYKYYTRQRQQITFTT